MPDAIPADGASIFASLSPDHLKDQHRLLKWLDGQSKAKSPVIATVDEKQKRRVLALAKQAVAEGDNPLGLFIHLLSTKAEPKKAFRAKGFTPPHACSGRCLMPLLIPMS